MLFYISNDSGNFWNSRNKLEMISLRKKMVKWLRKFLKSAKWTYCITHGAFGVRYLVNGLLNALKFASRFPIGSFGRWMQSHLEFAFSKDFVRVYRYDPYSMTPMRPQKKIVIVNFYLCLELYCGAYWNFPLVHLPIYHILVQLHGQSNNWYTIYHISIKYISFCFLLLSTTKYSVCHGISMLYALRLNNDDNLRKYVITIDSNNKFMYLIHLFYDSRNASIRLNLCNREILW